MLTDQIQKRYNDLAGDDCCLSCGGAINYADIREGDVCVDLGCGKGTDVIRMAQRCGESGKAYGIDVAEEMLKKAKIAAEKLSIKNAYFIKSPIDEIEIEDSSVDVLVSNCAINHAPDKKKVFNEIFRILKYGGFFVISDIYSSQEVPEEYKNDETAVAECWAGAVTKDEYLRVIEGAGFKDISIFEESSPYPKGKIEVSSFTIAARKKSSCSCGSC